ncbi:Endocytosis and vacuole integrity protein [Elasticomyces elasticus]|nr:Endocytosis and vacuole integrity protein [Elasticomyces elasticus]
MTAILLANELGNLISEAKRKHGDLKTAAEKSLQDLKALPTTSEQQFAADLGLDVQLKVLQALPSLLQNYSDELRDDLLASALQLCALLQSAKAQTVSGVAAATLQQLVSAVFEKVVDEDHKATEVPARHEVPGDGKPITLRPAAYDAYRMFRDLVLAAEERPTKFVRLTALSPESSLELIWSALSANARLFVLHPELSGIIRANLLPAVTRPLSERLPFALTVRSLRVMDILLGRYFNRFLEEFEVVLALLTQNLDLDSSAPWKRALAMEVVRNFFANGNCIVDAYGAYDDAEEGKAVVQDLLAAFVRLSAEKPNAIGLGQQSSIPTGPGSRTLGSDQTSLEMAGGVAGAISSALGVAEANVPGISSQWSLPRSACLEQLDKLEAPPMPETYLYAMVLDCLSSMSDTLAKIVVPLAAHNEKPISDVNEEQADESGQSSSERPTRSSRSQSFRQRAIPANPLNADQQPVAPRVLAVAGLVDTCWPAVLAICSTYLSAALEEQYYRNLIKACQRFAQVAGLLRLKTPRDALLTTLSKSAVPPHIVNAAMMDSGRSPTTPSVESARIFSNAKSLLSVDSLVSQTSTSSPDRRSSVEAARPMLSTRNLQSLRALLNLAIALGTTMETSFTVVVDALRQADLILSSSLTQNVMRQGAQQKGNDSPAAVQAFSAEVNAVEAAASRLLESTSEYPNESFLTVLTAFIRLLGARSETAASSPTAEPTSPPATPIMKGRTFSGLANLSTLSEIQERNYEFTIPKIGALASLNITRFMVYDSEESGWSLLVNALVNVAVSASKPREARWAATNVLCSTAAATVYEALHEEEDVRRKVQRRALAVLLHVVDGIYSEDGELTTVDLQMQGHVLDSLRSILERCGESLVAGWTKTLAIISSAFERTEVPPASPENEVETRVDWAHISNDLVSVQIGRSAFTALQLVCSDFLDALPQAVMPSLLELLHRFVSQSDDLNMALTTLTIVTSVADRLVLEGAVTNMDKIVPVADADDGLPHHQPEPANSRSAQLMTLLTHLRTAIRQSQGEVRNAAFQSMCNIYSSRGEQFSPDAWEFVLRTNVFNILSDDTQLSFAKNEIPGAPIKSTRADQAMSKVIILGVTDLVAQYVHTIELIRKLPSLWEALLNKLEAYLDCGSHMLNEAVYSALSRILSHLVEPTPTWTTPVYRAVSLWLKRLPEDSTGSKSDNQGAYVAYIEAGLELYRLAKQTMGTPQTRKMIDNVYHCVAHSTGPTHGSDMNNLSPLQSKAMSLLKGIRTDYSTLTASLISAAAHLAQLHHDSASRETTKNGPTHIAVASDAIDWLALLIRINADDVEVVESGAVLQGIEAYKRMVVSKYNVPAKCKGLSLWRKATSAAVDLSQYVLELPERFSIHGSNRTGLWTGYASIAAAIVNAKEVGTVATTTQVAEDELADINSFRKLRAILIPRLGSADLPEHTRSVYCHSLFDASIIHRTEIGEVPGAGVSPLSDLHQIRRGRARRVPYSKRERMSYVCLEELIALSSTPVGTAEDRKLAQAAAPLLILRLAIPIRAYIADHPLRGKSPQPLSELEELLYCFETIKNLKLHPDALYADAVASGRTGSAAHLHFLYPLLARAVAIAGSSCSGTQEVHHPLQSLLQAIDPFP